MKLVLSIIIFFGLLTSANAQSKEFCGLMNSISYQTDIYVDIRMGLYKSSDSSYITVKDPLIIQFMIGQLTGNPAYKHQSDMDDYYWSADMATVETPSFWICAAGTVRSYRSKQLMENVTRLRYWINGRLIYSSDNFR